MVRSGILFLAAVCALGLTAAAQNCGSKAAGGAVFCPAAMAAATSVPPKVLGDGPAQTIRRRVEEVSLTFTVSDAHGRSVHDLQPEDISVIDDHQPIGRLLHFSHDEAALRIGVLVDKSDSFKGELELERATATEFLQRVLRPGYDQAFVLSFAATSELQQPLTSDPHHLLAGAFGKSGNAFLTALFDAVIAACGGEMAKPGPAPGMRRVMLLLTDGEDNYSIAGLDDALMAAHRARVAIYAITLRQHKGADRGERTLKVLADLTGGRAYVVANRQQYRAALADIEREIRSAYLISYKPVGVTADGHFHPVDIRLRDPERHVHARRGYFEAKDNP